MREARTVHGDGNDLVLCCDNSVAYLLSDADILLALREFYDCIHPGGACLLSLRDYDIVEKKGSQTHSLGIRDEEGVGYRMFEVWDFRGEIYDVSLYVVVDNGQAAEQVNVFRTSCYAISPGHLAALMKEVGFSNVKRIDGQFFQPIVVGTR
jgi:hypothetical protein